jgi:hypothetical protein
MPGGKFREFQLKFNAALYDLNEYDSLEKFVNENQAFTMESKEPFCAIVCSAYTDTINANPDDAETLAAITKVYKLLGCKGCLRAGRRKTRRRNRRQRKTRTRKTKARGKK